METMKIVKKNFDLDINTCLLEIFFKENEEILHQKLSYQFNLTGTFFEQMQADEKTDNVIVEEILQKNPNFKMNDFIDMYV